MFDFVRDDSFDETSVIAQRRHFPTLTRKAYLNYGAMGLLPAPAQAAIVEMYDLLAENGPFTVAQNLESLQRLLDLREVMADELGADSTYISLLENTSTGCNVVLWGFRWQPGDHLIFSDCEYPGVVATLEELMRRHQITHDLWPVTDPDPQKILDQLDRCIRPRTRMVVLSHVLWTTGQILPLAEIIALVRHRGGDRIRVVVDAAQSVGVLPVNLHELDVDAYAFPGHKWWCGPEGMGGLFLHPRLYAEVDPTFIGMRGLRFGRKGERLGFHDDARRYEVSSVATPLFAGLCRALQLHREWGDAQARYDRILRLTRYAWRRLHQAQQRGLPIRMRQDSPPETGLLFVEMADAARMARLLESRDLLVRDIPGADCIRLSVHYLTLREDIDRLIRGLDEILR